MITKRLELNFNLFARIALFSIFLMCSAGTIWNNSTIVSSYTSTEWLINFAGGYVRRGMSGELILGLASTVGASPILVTNLFLLGIFLVNTTLIAVLIRYMTVLQLFTLLFAPSFLLMLPMDVMDRKENLFYLILFVHAVLILTKSNFLTLFQKLVLPLAGIATAFFHDFYLFTIPFHLILIFLSNGSKWPPRGTTYLNLLPASVFILTLAFPGNQVQRDLNCAKLESFGIACDGGVNALAQNAIDSIGASAHVLSDIVSLQSYFLVVLVTSLTLIAIFWDGFIYTLQTRARVPFALANIGFLIMVIVGWDFGRWIVIYSLHNFIVLLVAQREVQSGPGKLTSLPSRQLVAMTVAISFAVLGSAAFVNTKGCCTYAANEVFQSKISAFIGNGFKLGIERAPFDFEKFASNVNKEAPWENLKN